MPGFISGVLKIGSGTVLSQLIALGTLPIVTRLFTPSDFGKLAVYISLIMWIAPVSSLGYNATLMLRKRDQDAIQLLFISILIVFAISIIALITISGVSILIPIKSMDYWLWLIPIGIFLEGCLQTFTFWNLRDSKFHKVAFSKVANSIGDRVTVFCGYFALGNHPFILILARVVGALISLLIIFDSKIIKKNHVISKRRLKYFLYRYREFPLKSTWAILLSMGSLQLPLLLVAFIYGPVVAGSFLLTHRALQSPMKLIGDSVRQVYFKKATKNQLENVSNQRSAGILLSTLLYLAIPGGTFFVVFAPSVFLYFFGEKWSSAGEYASILVIGYISTFVQRPFSVYYDIYEKHNVRIVMYAITFTIIVASLALGWILDVAPYIVFLSISIITLVVNITQIFFLLNLAGWNYRNLINLIIRRILILSVIVVGMPLIDIMDITLLQSIISVVILIFAQIMMIYLLDHDIRKLGKPGYKNTIR